MRRLSYSEGTRGCPSARQLVVAAALPLCLLQGCTETTQETAAPPAASVSPQDQLKLACSDPTSTVRQAYVEHMSASRYLEAADAIRPCSRLEGMSEAGGLLKDAETRNLSRRVNDTKLPATSRILAFNALQQSYPEAAVPLEPEAAALRAQIARETAAALKRELAERGQQGVSIGMSADRVLQSSWGSPRKVNRTTTAAGTREQWIYDGGHLYFENGVLVAIQN